MLLLPTANKCEWLSIMIKTYSLLSFFSTLYSYQDFIQVTFEYTDPEPSG